MYKAQDKLDEFYKVKPELTNNQQMLLNAFYRLSQERRTEQGAPLSIKDKDIHYYQDRNGSCSLAPDLFQVAMHAIDSEYIKKKHDEIRKINKVK